MIDSGQARALSDAAERDISALRGMGDAAVFADEIFGFHVQQAAEKLLKAWLALRGQTYPLSHDLAALLDMLSVGGVDVADFDELVDYTPYAVRLRYATADPGVRPPDRPKAIRQVETLLAAVRCQLAATEAG
ncbi:MAG: HEPN domain-containing protein [Boseongicola sp.]|nr:HEPN domain-containing protein [Boseongicola sp.]